MTEEEFLRQYCGSMNAQQLEAVRAVDGAVLLLAVPGSGKTTVLVTRLGYMVCCCGIRPENILTMTYTVAATREMSARFTRLFGSAYGSAMEIRTINGLAQKIIDYYSETENRQPFTLQDDEGILSGLIRDLYREYYTDYPSESTIRDIRTAITYCKNSLMPQEELEEYDIGLRHFSDIYNRYCDSLRRARQMDYDDQLLYALNILKNRPRILEGYCRQYPYICVDESQDTSRLQHEIIRLLAGPHGNLFLVGDEDQSIYGFRAAYPDALVHFTEDYPGARTLIMEQNYRSTEEIIQAANQFVVKNRFRHPKRIVPTCGSGLPVQQIAVASRMVQHRFLYELACKSTQPFTVLSRNNDSLVPIIDLFERKGIPFQCRQFDEVFFSHRMLRDITDIIHFSEHGQDAECFLRIYHKLGCMISRTAAEYAIAQSAKTGKPLLLELIRCPELGQFSMHALTEIYEALEQLPQDSATDALSRIRYQIGYGEYVERSKLDAGKFQILGMLARNLPSAAALLDRLEQLRIFIRDLVPNPDAKVILSTIHSSKGLEYDRVYLLDVLNGILPGKPSAAAKTPEEIRQYEEERRLYYVAMTRARRELHIFRCLDQPSEFISETLRELPKETFEEKEFLSVFSGDHCGKLYHHAEKGRGRVVAQSESGMLLEFSGGESQLLTVDEMLRFRRRNLQASQQPTERPANVILPTQMRPDSRVEHITFGQGVVLQMTIESITVRFDSDGKERSFLKSAVLPTGKLKLLV